MSAKASSWPGRYEVQWYDEDAHFYVRRFTRKPEARKFLDRKFKKGAADGTIYDRARRIQRLSRNPASSMIRKLIIPAAVILGLYFWAKNK